MEGRECCVLLWSSMLKQYAVDKRSRIYGEWFLAILSVFFARVCGVASDGDAQTSCQKPPGPKARPKHNTCEGKLP